MQTVFLHRGFLAQSRRFDLRRQHCRYSAGNLVHNANIMSVTIDYHEEKRFFDFSHAMAYFASTANHNILCLRQPSKPITWV